ncbi:MAG TPA: alpha/beta hydrolase, partial [Acinetobacter ursingii]|nr:alpha/beta hydrolase [Acinetobacter ursingii]
MQRMESFKSLIHHQQIKLKHLSARLFHEESLVLSQTTPYQVIAEFGQTRVRYYAAA